MPPLQSKLGRSTRTMEEFKVNIFPGNSLFVCFLGLNLGPNVGSGGCLIRNKSCKLCLNIHRPESPQILKLKTKFILVLSHKNQQWMHFRSLICYHTAPFARYSTFCFIITEVLPTISGPLRVNVRMKMAEKAAARGILRWSERLKTF